MEGWKRGKKRVSNTRKKDKEGKEKRKEKRHGNKKGMKEIKRIRKEGGK